MFGHRVVTCLGAFGLGLTIIPAVVAQDLNEWDINADSGIDTEEFCTGFEDLGVFANWDINVDDQLSEEEFDTGISDKIGSLEERFGSGAYDTWDANSDGTLTHAEFCEGAYAGYDADESGVLEEPEFGDVGDDLGDEGFWDI